MDTIEAFMAIFIIFAIIGMVIGWIVSIFFGFGRFILNSLNFFISWIIAAQLNDGFKWRWDISMIIGICFYFICLYGLYIWFDRAEKESIERSYTK